MGAAVNDVIHESNKNSIVKFARSTIGEKQPELKMYLAKVGDFSHFYKKLNVKQMFEVIPTTPIICEINIITLNRYRI